MHRVDLEGWKWSFDFEANLLKQKCYLPKFRKTNLMILIFYFLQDFNLILVIIWKQNTY